MNKRKKDHVAKANKLFQERYNLERGIKDETKEIYHVPDIYPQLSKLLK
jgi:hypothetical protein